MPSSLAINVREKDQLSKWTRENEREREVRKTYTAVAYTSFILATNRFEFNKNTEHN